MTSAAMIAQRVWLAYRPLRAPHALFHRRLLTVQSARLQCTPLARGDHRDFNCSYHYGDVHSCPSMTYHSLTLTRAALGSKWTIENAGSGLENGENVGLEEGEVLPTEDEDRQMEAVTHQAKRPINVVLVSPQVRLPAMAYTKTANWFLQVQRTAPTSSHSHPAQPQS